MPPPFRLHAVFIPGSALIGNIAMVSVLIVGGYRVAEWQPRSRRVDGVPPCTCGSSTTPMEDVAVFYNSLQSRDSRVGEDRRGAGRGSGRTGAG